MISTKLPIKTLGIAAAVALAAVAGTPAEAQYYKGKSIALIVGFGPGSGVTSTARVFAKHFGKHIPGNPNVVVKNLPGAGSVKANNFVYEKARPDGLTLIFGPLFPFNEIISAPGVRYKFSNFTYIGGAFAAERVMFMRRDAVPGGAKTSADVMKAPKLRMVAGAASSPLSILSRPALDLLGLKYTFIPGHRGGGAVRNAVRNGTGNIAAHGLSGYTASVRGTQVKDGTSMPLWYFPLRNQDGTYQKTTPRVTDMPNFLDVYRQIKGKAPSGPHWKFFELVSELDTLQFVMFGPPNMNKQAATDLSKAYELALKDPVLQADFKKVLGATHQYRSPEFANKYFATINDLEPEMVEYSKQYIGVAATARRGKKGKRGKKR